MKRSSARASKRRARRPKKDAIAEQHRWKLSLLREFVAKHGWAKLSKKTIVPPGVRLFNFVRARRVDYADGEIADWLVQECEAIPGWSWSPVQDAYRRNLDNVRRLVRQHGWAWLRTKPIVDGVRLDRWVAHRRSEYNRGTIERWLIPALEALPGWTWKPRIDSQAKLLFALRGHVARHGWASIDQDTMSRNKLPIGHWSQNVRAAYRHGKLPQWLIAGLESIPGWLWEPRRDRQLYKAALLASYVEQHGWESVNEALVVKGLAIGTWVSYCRANYRRGILPRETVKALKAIPGWSWTPLPWSMRKGRDGRFVAGRAKRVMKAR